MIWRKEEKEEKKNVGVLADEIFLTRVMDEVERFDSDPRSSKGRINRQMGRRSEFRIYDSSR